MFLRFITVGKSVIDQGRGNHQNGEEKKEDRDKKKEKERVDN